MLANKLRYPLTLTYPSIDHGRLVDAAQAFVDHFLWRNIFILHDLLPQFPGLTTYYGLAAGNLGKRFTDAQYDVKMITIDSSMSMDFSSTLAYVKSQSRSKPN